MTKTERPTIERPARVHFSRAPSNKPPPITLTGRRTNKPPSSCFAGTCVLPSDTSARCFWTPASSRASLPSPVRRPSRTASVSIESAVAAYSCAGVTGHPAAARPQQDLQPHQPRPYLRPGDRPFPDFADHVLNLRTALRRDIVRASATACEDRPRP